MAKFGDIEFERRVFPRFVLHLPFTYQIDEENYESETSSEISQESSGSSIENNEDYPLSSEGSTANASQNGLQIYLPEKIKEGSILRLKMPLTEKNKVRFIEIKAQVVWITKSILEAPLSFKAGVKFVNITEEAKSFLKWFEQLWLEQSS